MQRSAENAAFYHYNHGGELGVGIRFGLLCFLKDRHQSTLINSAQVPWVARLLSSRLNPPSACSLQPCHARVVSVINKKGGVYSLKPRCFA
jgi:hypothetical protein